MHRVKEFLLPMMERMDLYQPCRDHLAMHVWNEVVGPHVRRNTAPVALKSGILFVKAASSAWVSELTMGFRHTFIAAINQRLGADVIKDIRFLPPPLPVREEPEEDKPGIPLHEIRLTREQAQFTDEVTAEIASEDIRDVFARCMQKGLQEEERRRLEGWKPCPGCGELFDDGGPCVRCRNASRQSRRDAVRAALEQAPWLSSADVKARVPELNRVDYEREKKKVQHRLRRHLEKWLATARADEMLSGDALTEALAYCMLRTGKMPHQLSGADVRYALGSRLAPRFPLS